VNHARHLAGEGLCSQYSRRPPVLAGVAERALQGEALCSSRGMGMAASDACPRGAQPERFRAGGLRDAELIGGGEDAPAKMAGSPSAQGCRHTTSTSASSQIQARSGYLAPSALERWRPLSHSTGPAGRCQRRWEGSFLSHLSSSARWAGSSGPSSDTRAPDTSRSRAVNWTPCRGGIMAVGHSMHSAFRRSHDATGASRSS